MTNYTAIFTATDYFAVPVEASSKEEAIAKAWELIKPKDRLEQYYDFTDPCSLVRVDVDND